MSVKLKAYILLTKQMERLIQQWFSECDDKCFFILFIFYFI